jgi:hypothetical protein
VALGQEMRERYPPRPDEVTGVPAVIGSGKSELYPEIPEELLEQSGLDEEQLRLESSSATSRGVAWTPRR